MQSIPLAVLKLFSCRELATHLKLHAIHTACGIETRKSDSTVLCDTHCMQSIPLAVLKRQLDRLTVCILLHCMQSIPLAVLKQRGCRT